MISVVGWHEPWDYTVITLLRMIPTLASHLGFSLAFYPSILSGILSCILWLLLTLYLACSLAFYLHLIGNLSGNLFGIQSGIPLTDILTFQLTFWHQTSGLLSSIWHIAPLTWQFWHVLNALAAQTSETVRAQWELPPVALGVQRGTNCVLRGALGEAEDQGARTWSEERPSPGRERHSCFTTKLRMVTEPRPKDAQLCPIIPANMETRQLELLHHGSNCFIISIN